MVCRCGSEEKSRPAVKDFLDRTGILEQCGLVGRGPGFRRFRKRTVDREAGRMAVFLLGSWVLIDSRAEFSFCFKELRGLGSRFPGECSRIPGRWSRFLFQRSQFPGDRSCFPGKPTAFIELSRPFRRPRLQGTVIGGPAARRPGGTILKTALREIDRQHVELSRHCRGILSVSMKPPEQT